MSDYERVFQKLAEFKDLCQMTGFQSGIIKTMMDDPARNVETNKRIAELQEALEANINRRVSLFHWLQTNIDRVSRHNIAELRDAEFNRGTFTARGMLVEARCNGRLADAFFQNLIDRITENR